MAEQHTPTSSCPSALSAASLQLHYLAEGAANIIYSVSVLSPPELQDHSHCCVMRLRKDLSFTKPAVEVAEDFTSRIAPLFADHGHQDLLMEQALYKLTPEMAQVANEKLREMEAAAEAAEAGHSHGHSQGAKKTKHRHHHRRHVYLPPYEAEQHGILMPNLAGPGMDWLVEFKPKWLVQSPSAPADARNCRTCALNAMRRKKAAGTTGRGDSGFCPMDLLAGKEDDGDDADKVLKRALANIWPVKAGKEGLDDFVAVFRERVQPALRHLLTLQREHGAVGLQDFQNPAGKDFGVAMALRDCSVFLALRRRSSGSIDHVDDGAGAGSVGVGVGADVVDVKFADLDLKTTEGGKIQKWATMEQDLLDGGWYYSADGGDCSLSRRHRPRQV